MHLKIRMLLLVVGGVDLCIQMLFSICEGLSVDATQYTKTYIRWATQATKIAEEVDTLVNE